MLKIFVCSWVGILLCSAVSYGQSIDTITGRLEGFPTRLLNKIQSRTASLDQQLSRQTQKYLQRMARSEERLEKQLFKVDSSAAKTLFAHSRQQYAALAQKLKTDTGNSRMIVSGPYEPYTDSLKGTLAFLQQNPQLLRPAATGGSLGATLQNARASASGLNTKIIPAEVQKRLQGATGQLQALQAKMQDAGQIQQYLEQRDAQIQQYLSRYTQTPAGITNTFKGYKEQLYYYDQQVSAYKNMLNDPDKLFRTALALLNKLPAFTGFMRSNSMLSGLLNMPGGAGNLTGTGQAVAGLSTRDQVLSGIQGQIGTNGPNASSLTQQNIGSAQGQVDQLRDKLRADGNGGGLNMPDFKPNGQKTKSFLSRLEYGVNLQTAHSTYGLPTTTDIGVSIGYKLNDNNRVGIGASYKVGWGSDINHIQLSSQGLGIRSFLDIQVKKSWFASGGFEYNYQLPDYSFHVLKDLSNWQQSGLIGMSKIISMKTRVFKNMKIQLLWDFLSYQQVPKPQPFQFRIGYVWR